MTADGGFKLIVYYRKLSLPEVLGELKHKTLARFEERYIMAQTHFSEAHTLIDSSKHKQRVAVLSVYLGA